MEIFIFVLEQKFSCTGFTIEFVHYFKGNLQQIRNAAEY
jgi:hypothetical protein